MGMLGQMTNLYIFKNNFSGGLPSEVDSLPYLSFCRVSRKEFNGPLSTKLGRVVNSLFSKTIPSEVSQLFWLEVFCIPGYKMRGEILDELFNTTKLFLFSVSDKAWTGTLSIIVIQLSVLLALEVSANRLTMAALQQALLNYGPIYT